METQTYYILSTAHYIINYINYIIITNCIGVNFHSYVTRNEKSNYTIQKALLNYLLLFECQKHIKHNMPHVISSFS